MSKQVPSSQMRSRYHKIRVHGVQMPLHRHIMEQHLGRKLQSDEAVHHLNGNRYDNRIENLVVMKFREHSRLENEGKTLTPEHRAKVSRSLLGNQHRTGKPHSQEIIAKIRERTREALQDPLRRAKISESLKGNQRTKGRKLSTEERTQISESMKRVRRDHPEYWHHEK